MCPSCVHVRTHKMLYYKVCLQLPNPYPPSSLSHLIVRVRMGWAIFFILWVCVINSHRCRNTMFQRMLLGFSLVWHLCVWQCSLLSLDTWYDAVATKHLVIYFLVLQLPHLGVKFTQLAGLFLAAGSLILFGQVATSYMLYTAWSSVHGAVLGRN